MNARHRRLRRINTRHHRRRQHTSWCRCPEPWQAALIAINRIPRDQWPRVIVRTNTTKETK